MLYSAYVKAPLQKVIRLTLASFLFIIGVLGLVLPLLNGTFFIVVALIVLSLEVPALEMWLDSLSEKNVKIEKIYKKMKHFIKKHF